MPAVCNSLLDDIEDIVSAQDLTPYDQQFRRKNVVPKARKCLLQKNVEADDEPPSDSVIPGVQKIWIRTWGCSHNSSDGEYMAGQLAAYGYKITVTVFACEEEPEKKTNKNKVIPTPKMQCWRKAVSSDCLKGSA